LQPAPIEGSFWLKLPDDLLAGPQQGHGECGPFFLAIELTGNRLVAEFLVRSQITLHCSCISYATKEQRRFLFEFLDRMLAEEGIRA